MGPRREKVRTSGDEQTLSPDAPKSHSRPADLLPQSVFIADESGNFRYVNRHAMTAFGYTEQDIAQGMNILSMIAPEDRQRASQDLQAISRGERASGIECLALRKDGSTFPMMAYIAPAMEADRLVGFTGTMLDLTDQKRDQQRSRESEQRFRVIFDNAAIGIVLVSRESRYVHANPAYQRMLGYSAEELVGMSFLDVTHPDDRVRDRTLTQDLFAGKRETFQVE
jgi:PAS domain S-box-containing protein